MILDGSLTLVRTAWWSEDPSGERVLQASREWLLDMRTRSMVEEEFAVVLVGSVTTWVKPKLDRRCIKAA